MSGGPGLSSVYVESLQKGSEAEYQYSTPKQGANVIRKPVFLYPEISEVQAGRSGPIRFKFPNTTPADFRRRSYLMISVTLGPVGGGGTYRRLAQGVWSIINRIRYEVAGDRLDERQNYNAIFSVDWNALQDPQVESTIGTELLGIGTQAQRNAWGDVTKRYWLPIAMGYLGCGVIPFNAFGPVIHQLEIYLDQTTAFIETDGTGVTCTINDIQWLYDEVTSWDGSYERDLIAMVNQGKFITSFPTTDPYINAITTTNQDLIISQRHMSIESLINIIFDSNNRYVQTVNDKFMNHPKTFGGATVQAYQFKISGKMFPEEEVDCTGDAIEAYQYYLGLVNASFYNTFGGNAPTITLAAFNLDNFLMIGDFRNCHDPGLINNFSTETAALDIIFKIRTDVAPAPGWAIMHILYYNVIVVTLPNSKIVTRS